MAFFLPLIFGGMCSVGKEQNKLATSQFIPQNFSMGLSQNSISICVFSRYYIFSNVHFLSFCFASVFFLFFSLISFLSCLPYLLFLVFVYILYIIPATCCFSSNQRKTIVKSVVKKSSEKSQDYIS